MTRLLNLRVFGAGIVLSTALLAAGCGSNKNAETTTTTSTADWADGVCSAVTTFVSTTKDLGKPDTSDGAQAKATLDTLSSQLEADVSSVQSSTESGVLAGISKASGALATAQTQIKTAFDQLKALDAKGELGDAFSQASSCTSLTG